MPTRKSIRDIKMIDTISLDRSTVEENTIPESTPVKKVRSVSRKIAPIQVESPEVMVTEPIIAEDSPSPVQNRESSGLKTSFKKKIGVLSQIKPVYLISFTVIILAIIVFIFIPKNDKKDPLEQSKKEAEIVKKQFSKHMILPEAEQIDIRKITNKIEDPFFKDAMIGDYLIIFYKNRIAYIYSVDKDIIVNAGVVFIDPKTATTTNTVGSTTNSKAKTQ